MSNVVITRAEALCALGGNFAAVAGNLPKGVPPSSEASAFEFHQFASPVSCFRVRGADPVEILGKKGLRTKDWSTKLLLCALEMGFKDIVEPVPENARPGVCVGTAFGSVESIGNFLSESIVSGVNNVNPQAFANTVINAPTSNANVRFTLRALSSTVSTGFNASLDAIVYAADYLRSGYLDWIIVGGFEEVSYYELIGLQRSGLLAADGASRPFARDGRGIVAGEGCALFMLETEDHARARGAEILGRIAGYAAAFDPGQPGASDDVACHAIQTACAEAGTTPDQLGFVAASASGRLDLDTMEARALARLCPAVPVTAYKRSFGECYGASTALSLACAMADMRAQRITGIGAGYPAIEGPALVREDRTGLRTRTVLINAFSCDGNCGSIIFRAE